MYLAPSQPQDASDLLQVPKHASLKAELEGPVNSALGPTTLDGASFSQQRQQHLQDTVEAQEGKLNTV